MYAQRTAELSQNLKKVYKGELTINNLLKIAEDEIREIVTQDLTGITLQTSSDFKNNSKNTNVGICPKCNKNVMQLKGKYGTFYKCENCDFKISGKIAGKNITSSLVKELLTKGKTKKISGFKSKAGKDFSSSLILKDDGTIGFDFN